MLPWTRAAEVGFKSGREFLRNISIGAVGTRQVARLLNEGGFRIIELERYSMSNKIWGTKIKRLRVPDLLCLRTGIRFESRAKSTLQVTMSHALNNPDRAWDKGLRDSDLIAFILCKRLEEQWVPSDRMTLFRVGEMRQAAGLAGLGRMKAASEGSEVQLTWPARIPKQSGHVVSVSPQEITTRFGSGRSQPFQLQGRRGGVTYRLHSYVREGDEFGEEDTIIASAMPNSIPALCPEQPQYDFPIDLDSGERETVYAAVKALGFLPESRAQSVPRLLHIMNEHTDLLVRLEAASSLARLGIGAGWDRIRDVATTDGPIEVRMESALILGECERAEAVDVLSELARNPSNPPELRAAGAWGMAAFPRDIHGTPLLELLAVDEDLTAVHAIVAASRLLTNESLDQALDLIGPNARQSAGIVRAITVSRCNPVERVVTRLEAASAQARPWLLYLLASLGRDRCEQQLRARAPDVLAELEFFWAHHKENWINRLDVADQIDFLMSQFPD